MKFKWQFWAGWTFAAVVLTWWVLAYIFMCPPVVNEHRYTSACRNNLRQIDAAINEFALEHKKHTGDSVTLADLTPYIKLNGRGEIPGCPAGGKYTIGPVGTPPTCSFGTNPSVKVRYENNPFYWYYSSESGAYHKLP
jgi:hypothetical protein